MLAKWKKKRPDAYETGGGEFGRIRASRTLGGGAAQQVGGADVLQRAFLQRLRNFRFRKARCNTPLTEALGFHGTDAAIRVEKSIYRRIRRNKKGAGVAVHNRTRHRVRYIDCSDMDAPGCVRHTSGMDRSEPTYDGGRFLLSANSRGGC